MTHRSPIRSRGSEQGFMMVAVVFLVAALVIALAVGAPVIRKQIQRDREEETMERGKQYIRAVQLYYRKFHAYPPNQDALVKTQEIRFLRKKYIDPLTGKDDWKPIQFGQNKAPTAMGFFGQPLGGSSIAGIGPSGGNGLNGTNGANGQPGSGSAFGSTFGSGGSGSSTFGSNNSNFLSPSSSTGLNSPTGAGTGSGTDPSAGTGAGPGTGSTDPNTGASGSGTGTGIGGGSFGGAGIIGFSPDSPKQSILVYKQKSHYNEWEFVYDPLSERTNSGSFGGGLSGNSGGGIGTSGTSFGSQPTPSTGTTTAPTNPQFGPNGNLPTAPTQPQTPTQPQN